MINDFARLAEIKTAEPMRIGLGIDLRCLSEPNWSGVATYTRLMVAALAREAKPSLKITAFTSGLRSSSEISAILPPHSVHRHLDFPNRILNLTITFFHYPSARRCFGGVKLIWQPNPLFLSPAAVPLFVTLHDLSFVRFPQFFRRRTRMWYLHWVRRWLKNAPALTHLIVDSNFVKNDVESIYPRWRGRVTVLRPPPPRYPPAESALDIEQIYGLKRPYILALGTIEPRKNINSLIAAYKIFAEGQSDFDLVLAGKYSHNDLSDIARAAGKWQSRVKILGYLSPDHREAVLSRAFCLVYPSYYEGFGYPPLEAMCRGVPVVASAASSLPEILGSAAIYIDPYRAAEEIAAALGILVDSRAVYENFQRAGLDRVEALSRAFTLEPLLKLWRACV